VNVVLFLFWVIPRLVNCLYRRFDTFCVFHFSETLAKKIQARGNHSKRNNTRYLMPDYYLMYLSIYVLSIHVFLRRIYDRPRKFIKKRRFHKRNISCGLYDTRSPTSENTGPPSLKFYFSSSFSSIRAFFEPTTISKLCGNRSTNLCASQPYYPA
jgi:hypothetical protein